MINVLISEGKFEYDIHSLMKAFFTKDDVRVAENLEEYDFRIDYADGRIVFSKEGDFEKTISVPKDVDTPTQKNLLKHLMYEALCEHTKKTLPWGDLTGIRPTKIPMKMLSEQKDDEEILKYMKDTYYISDEKGLLSIDIAKREKRILDAIHYENGYSLYIGIPFCPTTCLYCSFTSNPIFSWKKRVNEYLDCVIKELLFTKERFADKTLDTIYIGGGTPTTLEADELEKLLSAVDRCFDTKKLLEFTVEAGRADSITREKLEVLKKHNVTRISVNPQTMNQKTLDVIGRRHTVEDVYKAYALSRELSFDNINMDIILGLPGEGPMEVQKTIDEIVGLKPDSLTVHSLAIKKGSRLNQWIEENGYEAMINTDDTMAIAQKGAKRLGLNPYYLYRQKNMAGNFENVGYAREGAYGIYNILIMEEVQTIVACGAGTVTKRVDYSSNESGFFTDARIERCDNVKDVALYIEKIDEMIERKRNLFKD